jgi:hypothetical protein
MIVTSSCVKNAKDKCMNIALIVVSFEFR